MTWRPIETAPKDRTSVLLGHDQAVFDGWWEPDIDAWVDGATDAYDDPIEKAIDTEATRERPISRAAGQHTPGPWVTHPWFPEYVVPAAHADRPVGGADDDAYDLSHYAQEITTGPCWDRHRSTAEVRANARLIAAAPDLLDGCSALLGLLQLLAGRGDVPADILPHLLEGHRIDEARAAVAKATASPISVATRQPAPGGQTKPGSAS